MEFRYSSRLPAAPSVRAPCALQITTPAGFLQHENPSARHPSTASPPPLPPPPSTPSTPLHTTCSPKPDSHCEPAPETAPPQRPAASPSSPDMLSRGSWGRSPPGSQGVLGACSHSCTRCRAARRAPSASPRCTAPGADGRTDRRTDGRTGGRAGGRTDFRNQFRNKEPMKQKTLQGGVFRMCTFLIQFLYRFASFWSRLMHTQKWL